MSLNGVVGGVELAGLKKDYTDFGYSDIGGVKLEKGIARSTIKLTLKRGEEPLELDKLPNSVAEKGYGTIRENVWIPSTFCTRTWQGFRRPQGS